LVTVDTSALIAAVDRGDANHTRSIAFFRGESLPLIIPAGILSEICYFLETRLGPRWLDEFLGNIATGAFMVEFVDTDMQLVF